MITVLFFGKLTELAGPRISIDSVSDTDAAKAKLIEQFPSLATEKWVMAVNKTMVNGNVVIPASAEIALMPPFSGG